MNLSHFLLFPINYSASYVPFSLCVVALVTIFFLRLIIDLFYCDSSRESWVIKLFDVVLSPFLVLLFCFACYAICDLIQLYFPHTFDPYDRFSISCYLTAVELAVFAWVIVRGFSFNRKYKKHR